MGNHSFISEIKSALFGLAIGDALGVPVEFRSRDQIAKDPVTDMRGMGTYNLPAGTFSDDSSMAFCMAEALTGGFNLNAIAHNFVRWYTENYWTPRGEVFDIGIATREAISRLQKGAEPTEAGGRGEDSNGNGSLMRILPLLFHIWDKPIKERWHLTQQVSQITHRHIRSVIACFYYLEFARGLLLKEDPKTIYTRLQTEVPLFLNAQHIEPAEVSLFKRLLEGRIWELQESTIQSSGYVLHTLEASIWCLLTSNGYAEATLKAVNLGEDTDTTGAVTGGLAGLLWGIESIPEDWLVQLARREDVEDVCQRLAHSFGNSL
jgi:ADP-ribosylglycohydrolase